MKDKKDVKKRKKEKKILIILIISLIVIDQVLKIIFEGFIANTQNIFSTDNITYILVSFIAIMLIIRYISSNNTYIKLDSKIVLSFATAGVISNLIDRIFRGMVVNYIDVKFFDTINLAYIYIIITWIGFAILLTRHTAREIMAKKTEKRIKEEKIEKEFKDKNRKKD